MRGFYSGISASLMRQLTYSTTRFAVYDQLKLLLSSDTFLKKALCAASAGGIASILGVPFDLMNVRMQNDIKLPIEQRRNYKHVFDGVARVVREEGLLSLFSGATFTIIRSMLVNVGSIGVYDQIKQALMSNFEFKDGVFLYLISSLSASITTTLISQPIDVLKTRAMNAKPGQYSGLTHIIMDTAKTGPLTFYKGTLPTFARVGPQVIVTYLILEQLRKNFGIPTND